MAFDLSGDTQIERNFIQNFLLPEKFKHIDEGMLPMCYPSEHPNKNHIPNWAMWFVIQLEEYLQRSGDREMIDAAKDRVYALIEYFKPFINEDGLLEKLTRWVFVEWSRANSLVQDVSYPSNMLYAQMLDAAGRLYGDNSLHLQAEAMRETIRKQSFDGEYFIDNAVNVIFFSGELTPADPQPLIRRKFILAPHIIPLDGELPHSTVKQNGKAHHGGSSVIGNGIQGSPDGPPALKNIIYKDDDLIVQIKGDTAFKDLRQSFAHADVIPVHGSIQRTHGIINGSTLPDIFCKTLRQRDSAALDPDKNKAFGRNSGIFMTDGSAKFSDEPIQLGFLHQVRPFLGRIWIHVFDTFPDNC